MVEEKELEEIIVPVLEELGIDLVELKLLGAGNKTILRIYVNEVGGITLDRCTQASRAISDILDRKDPIPSRYILQVSSPGIDRPLHTEREYFHHLDKKISVVYQEGEEEQKLTGVIKDVKDGAVTLVDDREQTITLDISKIKIAKEVISFNK